MALYVVVGLFGIVPTVNAAGQCTSATQSGCEIYTEPTSCTAEPGCTWEELQSTTPTGVSCFCFDDNFSDITTENYTTVSPNSGLVQRGSCQIVSPQNCQTSNQQLLRPDRSAYKKCQSYANTQLCAEAVSKWESDFTAQLRAAASSTVGLEARTGLSSFIPSCAFEEDLTDECKDIGIFVILLINISRFLFSIIGALALLMFIYGGFMMIISHGSSEMVDKGKGAMSAAVIGLVVAFSGYLLIYFIGSVIGVGNTFKL